MIVVVVGVWLLLVVLLCRWLLVVVGWWLLVVVGFGCWWLFFGYILDLFGSLGSFLGGLGVSWWILLGSWVSQEIGVNRERSPDVAGNSGLLG